MNVSFSSPRAACSCGGCGTCQTRVSLASAAQKTAETHDAQPSADASAQDGAAAKAQAAQPLADRYTPTEQQQIQELKTRDREVRAHEAAHKAAAGPHARGGASYTYQRGPDGVRYAIGGEVSISLSPIEGDPEATMRKAQQIRAAALAPAEPSAQDYAVAARAAQMALQAQTEAAETAEKTDRTTATTTDAKEKKPDAETNAEDTTNDAVRSTSNAQTTQRYDTNPRELGTTINTFA